MTDWRGDVYLTVICVLMQHQTICSDYFAELGSVEHEKQWSQYRTPWNSERHRDRTRQFAFVDDLLCPVLNKRCKPANREHYQSAHRAARVATAGFCGQHSRRLRTDVQMYRCTDRCTVIVMRVIVMICCLSVVCNASVL